MAAKAQSAKRAVGEARIARAAAASIRTTITLAGGNEVCFVATVDDDGIVTQVRVAARGDVRSVLAMPGIAQSGEMLLHNHPSGLLEPSDADMEIAAKFHEEGIGFGIVDNEASRLYVVTEVPPLRATKDVDPHDVDGVLAPEGLVAQAMCAHTGARDYEDRPTQREMARAIAERFNQGGVALLEAGTGVGKSLGYLVPALRWAAQNRERTVVSTNTITLQEQLVGKDLPFLAGALTDQKVRFALLKGWRNYVCLHRLEQARGAGAALFEDAHSSEVTAIADWAAKTHDGSLADLPIAPRPEVWDEVAAEPDLCLRLNCQHYEQCFLFKARREAAQADVIVVNHHLLLADVAVRRTSQNWTDAAVLPSYKRLVVDEGHHLEEAAASHLGSSVTRRALIRLFNRLERRGRGLLPALAARLAMRRDLLSVASLDLVNARLAPSAHAARDRASLLFDQLQSLLDASGNSVMRLNGDAGEEIDAAVQRSVRDALDELLNELKLLQDGLRLVRERLEAQEQQNEDIASLMNEVRAVTRRLEGAGDALVSALRKPASGPAVVRWIELSGRPGGDRNVTLHCVPLELAPVLREDLFDRMDTAVVTSATLAASGSFRFLERRLGISDVKAKHSAVLASPFDYPRQALLVVPTDLPAPNEDPAAHLEAVAGHLHDLAAASDGGIFALFTSHRDVREMADRLRAVGADVNWPLLVHGEEPRDHLLQRFQDSGRAVLLGTATFWEGIDVPGDALRGLLIAKLPFRVPTEPMVAAQCEAIEARGGNAFREFMLPHASLRLKQGFGRLIRTKTDRGVVVLSDPRVLSKWYGRELLDGLPPASRLRGEWPRLLRRVQQFYGASEGATVTSHTTLTGLP